MIIRRDKPDNDRVVPLSPNLTEALKTYLPQRGETETDHLLIFHQQVIRKTLVGRRLRHYGRQIKVEVSPHRLRHTLATRLLNQGMPITSIQKLLGHEGLDTTNDETVRQDYERAHTRLQPATSLAEEFFGAATQEVEPQPVTAEANFV